MARPDRNLPVTLPVDGITGEVLDSRPASPSGSRKIHWESYDVEESWGEQSPHVSHPAAPRPVGESVLLFVAVAAGVFVLVGVVLPAVLGWIMGAL